MEVQTLKPRNETSVHAIIQELIDKKESIEGLVVCFISKDEDDKEVISNVYSPMKTTMLSALVMELFARTIGDI